VRADLRGEAQRGDGFGGTIQRKLVSTGDGVFRVWHYIVRVIAPLLMVGMALFFVAAQNTILQAILVICLGLFILLGIVGGVMGILLATGKLKMACPFCRARGQIFADDRGMLLLCPACGFVHETGFMKLRLAVIPQEESTSTDTDESTNGDAEETGLQPVFPAGVVYFRRWKTLRWFVLLILPVLASIAMVIVRGQYAAAVALLLLHGLMTVLLFVILSSGAASSTAGNFERHKTPIRYWLSVGAVAFWYGVLFLFACYAK